VSISALLIHRVTVTRPTTRTSNAGDTVKAGTYAATTVTDAPCRAQAALGGATPGVQRERAAVRWRLTIAPTDDVKVRDRATITVDGVTRTMEVLDVRPIPAATGTHHLQLECDEVTG
jgi:hypothetical protein